jgi:hypothetical protein
MDGDTSDGYDKVNYLSSAGTKTVTIEAILAIEVVSKTTIAFTLTL